jgi:hypothetical protein
MAHEYVNEFHKLLVSDLNDYREAGNISAVEALCCLITYFRIRFVIHTENDILTAIQVRIKYLDKLGDVYLENDMALKYSKVLDEIEILNKYLDLYNKHCYQS